ncbi:hypothetical protein TNCV_585261 [Trichonephila clavipes]|nr:hypothetical protein TNCV_585261 [Trichonephila clavipes]
MGEERQYYCEYNLVGASLYYKGVRNENEISTAMKKNDTPYHNSCCQADSRSQPGEHPSHRVFRDTSSLVIEVKFEDGLVTNLYGTFRLIFLGVFWGLQICVYLQSTPKGERDMQSR